MAVREIVELLDDLDGSAAVETARFGVDGMNYEIDLNATHLDELRNAMSGYVSHGRRVGRVATGGNGRSGAKATTSGRKDDAKQARAFAKLHGLPVSARGRVSEDMLQAWRNNDPESMRPVAEPLSA